MERLISSSPLLRRAPAAPRPRAHRPPFEAFPPCRGPAPGPPLAPLLVSRHRPVAAPPPVPTAAATGTAPSAAAGSEDGAASGTGRHFFRKVTYAAAAVLLSAIIVALVHPSWALAHFHPTAAKAGTATTTTLFKSELLGSAWTGFLAGCLHTLSGPDHLAALAPLSIGRSRVESAAVGALWGCGHDAGQLIFGLLFLGLRDRLRVDVVRTWGTRVVALTLLAIGALGIREAADVPPAPCVAALDGAAAAKNTEIGFATFATGIVHGLQPDALMMVLPALALPSRAAGAPAAFLAMFLVGTVVSMGTYTVLIGSCTEALKERVPRITEKLTWAASLLAISMGLAILVSQSFGVTLY